MKTNSGFTLLEILIVMAIIAILATISVPTYTQYIAKEKLRTAQSDLQLLSLKFEYRYQRVLSYPTTAFDDTATLIQELSNWTPASDSGEFNFSSENATGSSYTVKATGLAGSATDCVITLTHDGNKTISSCDSFAADGHWL